MYGKIESRYRFYQKCSMCSKALLRGMVVRIRICENTQARRSATTTTDRGDRTARGPSGSCSAVAQEDIAYLRIYCCCVCVRVRGLQNAAEFGTISKQCLEKNYVPCPHLVDFPNLELVITNIRLHTQCTQILVWVDLAERSRSVTQIGVL